MSEPFIGEIRIVPYNFAPQGWAFCNGQLLPINQNTALFSLLGTTYGGNGQTTFALPDLRSRVPVGAGAGPGLSNYVLGQMGGSESVTLTSQQMPNHNHSINVSGTAATASGPAGNFPAVSVDPNTLGTINSYGTAPDTTLNPNAVTSTGNNQPHLNIQPYLVFNFIIALQGIYPSRG